MYWYRLQIKWDLKNALCIMDTSILETELSTMDSNIVRYRPFHIVEIRY
jgi:hypothetical protein